MRLRFVGIIYDLDLPRKENSEFLVIWVSKIFHYYSMIENISIWCLLWHDGCSNISKGK